MPKGIEVRAHMQAADDRRGARGSPRGISLADEIAFLRDPANHALFISYGPRR